MFEDLKFHFFILVKNHAYKSLRPKFNILILAFVEGGILIRIKNRYLQLQYSPRSQIRTLEKDFKRRASRRFTCGAGVTNYRRYDKTLPILLLTFTITLPYTLTISLLYIVIYIRLLYRYCTLRYIVNSLPPEY